jgi:hypothetical protein
MNANSITNHAIERFQQRTGCKKRIKAVNTLLRMFGRSKPAAMSRHEKAVRLYPSEYRCAYGWVLVIKANQIVTCYQTDHDQVLPLQQ